ncbi:hypothetical protein ASPZODRAFT_21205, partial [Penicilliopsis zonata CBS 506.65]
MKRAEPNSPLAASALDFPPYPPLPLVQSSHFSAARYITKCGANSSLESMLAGPASGGGCQLPRGM